MGVVYCLKRASDQELTMLQDRPKLIGRFLFDDDEVFQEQASIGGKIKGFFTGKSGLQDDFRFEEREENRSR